MSVYNIIKALDKEGRFIDIPDCSRDDLPLLFREKGFKTGVEVGVYKGEFTRKLLDAGLKVYGVDPWKIYRDYKNQRGQDRLDYQFAHTQRYLADYLKTGQCELIRKTSMEAVNDFKDKSLDFIYIDGNHLFRYVAEDLVEWSEKIKDNGIISGHDYFKSAGTRKSNAIHVQFVVDAFVGVYFVPKLYALGSRLPKEGEQRDKWRSWMFFKNFPVPIRKIEA